jgi:exosortase
MDFELRFSEVLRKLAWHCRYFMSHFVQVETLPPRIFISRWKAQICKVGALCVLIAWLYSPIIFRLAKQCWYDPNCSHGFLVPIFSGFVLWRERSRLFALIPRPSPWGLPLLIFSVSVLVVGVLGAELLLSRVSLVLLVASLIIYLLGWGHFRVALFPLAFLTLMIPLPEILLSQITFPLQILASKLAAVLLPFMGVPVLREGNLITIPVMPLEVAEACSGIRSLLSLVTLAIIYGYFLESRKSIRVLLAVAAIPIAVMANGLRVVGTGLLAQYGDPSKAQGFYHSFSGLFIFLLSLALLSLLHLTPKVLWRAWEARRDAL